MSWTSQSGQYYEQMKELLGSMSALNKVYDNLDEKAKEISTREGKILLQASTIAESLDNGLADITSAIKALKSVQKKIDMDNLLKTLEDSRSGIEADISKISARVEKSIKSNENLKQMLLDLETVTKSIGQVVETQNKLKARLESLEDFDSIGDYVGEIKQNLSLCREIRDDLLNFKVDENKVEVDKYLRAVRDELAECLEIKKSLGEKDSSIEDMIMKVRSLKSEYMDYVELRKDTSGLSGGSIVKEIRELRDSMDTLEDIRSEIERLKDLDYLREINRIIYSMNENITSYNSIYQDLKEKEEKKVEDSASGHSIVELYALEGFKLPIEVRKKNDDQVFIVNEIKAVKEGALALGTLLKRDGIKEEKYKTIASLKGYTKAY